MSDNQLSSLPERNPVTHRAHRREVLLQITIPFGISLVIILVASVLVSLGPDDSVSRWGDTSLIWLIIPQLLVCLLFLILMGALAFGVIWLVRILPRYTRQLQDLFNRIGLQTRKITDTIVEPVLRIQSFRAKLKAISKPKGLRR
jgi:uncharacterized BrkB/YihY/UPF0761 family membrane protein